MNKKKKKHLRLLIIVISIIILFVLFIFKGNKTENSLEENIFTKKSENIEKYINGKTVPQGISIFIKEYKGNISRDEFYQGIYTSARFLPDFATSIKKYDDLNNYYKENYAEIVKYIGLDNKTDFDNLANYIAKNDISGDEFNYCTYEEGTMYNTNGYSTFKMKFNYRNFGDIEFVIKILNKKSKDFSTVIVLAPLS